MQTVTGGFDTASKAAIRNVAHKFEVAWDQSYSATFFSIGSSTIGSSDIIKGNGLVPNESDQLSYIDESDYVESIEIDRFFNDPVPSIAKAALDVVLDNTSGRFTPNGGSSIQLYLKSGRAMKVELGFNFAGITERVRNFLGINPDFPTWNDKSSTFSIHALDLSYALSEVVVPSTILLEDYRADQIIELLLGAVGVDSTNYELSVGQSIIPFLLISPGDKIGDIIAKVVQAEGGLFFSDETGKFKFWDRNIWNTAPYNVSQVTITDDMIIEQQQPSVNNIVNACEVKSSPRALQDRQPVFKLASAVEILPGEAYDEWVAFQDPVKDAEVPVRAATSGSTFIGGYDYQDEDGLLSDYLDVETFDAFTSTAHIVIRNNHTENSVFLKNLTVWGQPAKVYDTIDTRAENEDSITEYGEQLLTIENDLIQSRDYAYSLAKMIVEDRKDISNYLQMTIKGLPQLQLGDLVTRNSTGYNVTRVKTKLTASDGLVQTLTLVRKSIIPYIRTGVSLIGDADRIAP